MATHSTNKLKDGKAALPRTVGGNGDQDLPILTYTRNYTKKYEWLAQNVKT